LDSTQFSSSFEFGSQASLGIPLDYLLLLSSDPNWIQLNSGFFLVWIQGLPWDSTCLSSSFEFGSRAYLGIPLAYLLLLSLDPGPPWDSTCLSSSFEFGSQMDFTRLSSSFGFGSGTDSTQLSSSFEFGSRASLGVQLNSLLPLSLDPGPPFGFHSLIFFF
jgi:hypothetical protein